MSNIRFKGIILTSTVRSKDSYSESIGVQRNHTLLIVIMNRTGAETVAGFEASEHACVCPSQPCVWVGWKRCPACGPKKGTCRVRTCIAARCPLALTYTPAEGDVAGLLEAGRRMDTWILSDTQEKAVLHILWYVQYLEKASIAHTAVCAILAEKTVLHIQVSVVLQIPGQVRSSDSPERK